MKTFQAPKPERRLLPIPFELSGYYVELDEQAFNDALGVDGPVQGAEYEPRAWTEKFVAQATLPPGLLISLASLITVNRDGSQVYNLDVINQFMMAVLANDEQRARWTALLNDKDRLVDISLLGEVTMWLGEQVVGRPTSQ